VLAVILALVGVAVFAAPAGAACSIAGRPMPGAGRLEFKPSGRAPLRVRGPISLPWARTGNTLIVSGITSIDGRRRHGLAAIDMRRLRALPFDPVIPANRLFSGLAASAGAVYLAYGTFEDGDTGPKELKAFDLRTGAELGGFAPPDFRDGLLGAMAYANGRLFMAGAPAVGAGVNLGAYDPVTGAPIWRDQLDWPVHSLVTDGSRVFVGEDSETPDNRGVTAFDAATGAAIGGWGATLPQRRIRSTVLGLDPSRVFVFSGSRARPELLVVAKSDGHAVRLPRLPSNAVELLSGTERTLLGRIRVQPRGGGPRILIGAVFDTSGRLVGTVCSRYQVLAQVDDRHLLAYDAVGQSGNRIYELVRPRR
jgi:outer membrane protein assembly factor BamB